jgi:hypothetical protein
MAEDMKAEKPSKKTVSVGEVLAKDKAAKPEAKKSDKIGQKKKHKHTNIEHHDDGSHTVRHTPVGGGEETSYAAPDLDAVHDGLEQHVGNPNDGEESQEQSSGPTPSPMAQPAPAQV